MRSTARMIGLAAAALALAAPAAAQRLEPPATGGVAELDRALRRLAHDRRVLMIGAHPDDEDTGLLTVLTRGAGAEAAYLSLTRGEGGQNLIGPELGEPLGLLRTEELLAARALDGARQFFSRAYDFGYSRNLEDTWAHWPRDSVLKDVVRVIRRFRPQVVVSVFSGTERDGHGQHQAAGWAAHEAFAAAGDPSRFPELEREEGLAPWQPAKLYRSTRFDSAATTLTLAAGVLDPAEGRSYHQIAMRSRSLHRSQDMGQLQRIGPSAVRLALVRDRTGEGGGGLFAGVDTTGGAAFGPSYVALVDSARVLVGPGRMAEVRDVLLRARATLVAHAGAAAGPVVHDQLTRLDEALAVAGRVVVDAIAGDDRVAPGAPLVLTLHAWNASGDSVTVVPRLRPAWAGAADSRMLAPRTLAPGALVEWTDSVRVPPQASPTAPYFVRDTGESVYRLDRGAGAAMWATPAAPPPLRVEFAISPPGQGGYSVTREAAFRFNDQAVGEVRRPVTIVPRIDVRLTPRAEVWPLGDTAARTVTARLRAGAGDTVSGHVRLEVPPGWTAPAPAPFALQGEGDQTSVTFTLRPPASLVPGEYRVRAVAETTDGARFTAGLADLNYPHVRSRSWIVPAELVITAAPLALPAISRIGYIRGAADRVPEALRDVGLPVELLDGPALAGADLSRYDAIIVGPRAYEVDSALVEQNRRLLAYADGGGLLIVQYQQYAFFTGDFAPYTLEVSSRRPGAIPSATTAAQRDSAAATVGVSLLGGHDRVTDETAPVRILRPDHPAMQSPNDLGPGDWNGWVQERGLYFARAWDERYTPLLEMHDPGERALQGGLLVAPVGQGTYVYTGLSFFRQLPAGVPGAYRLFANLLGLAQRPSRRPAS